MYQDKAQQLGSEAVEAGRGDPMKTIKTIRGLLEKLGADVEDHRRKSPGPRQMTQNADGLDAHASSLKHLESSFKWLQAVLKPGYEMAVRVAQQPQ